MSPRKRSAFTLIETLIVVSIIGILAAITFSVMASAKRKSIDAKVASNMHQMAMAVQMYMDNYQAARPPLDLSSLWDDPSLRPLGRTPGVPWTPGEVDGRPRKDCPLFGDLVYSRYVHPFWTDDGWDFWFDGYERNPPLFASLHIVANELEGVPKDDDHACGRINPMMVSKSLQVRLDGSMRLEPEPDGGRGTFFSFANLFYWER